METWFIIVVTLCISFFLKSLFDTIISSNSKSKKKLPPGPYTWPVIGTLLWARRNAIDLERILVDLKANLPSLIKQGSVFSDRQSVPSNNNNRSINSAPYGPTWRLLRRNLFSEMLHPSRIKSYSKARAWVLDILLNQLRGKQDESVKLVDHFQYAMFCLLVLMCFGNKLDEPQIKKIENMQVKFLLGSRRFAVLGIFPRLGKLIFRKLWKEFNEQQQEQQKTYQPLIEARIKAKEQKSEHEDEFVTCYVDTLLNLEWSDEKRKLNHEEIVTLCVEFLAAGTDTTYTTLQWIMANLVKNPTIQENLYQEIATVVGEKKSESTEEEVKEEDLQKMPYLKAVILEGLPSRLEIPRVRFKEIK
ncbi:hypothetical protein P3S68_007203 [Capsicum galapagoense]